MGGKETIYSLKYEKEVTIKIYLMYQDDVPRPGFLPNLLQ
jgi:hypothetical protein